MKVMIVDDEKPIRQWFEFVLKDIEEFDIEIIGSHSNGKFAYEACQKQLPNIIFTDIIMPQMDGIELIYKVKELSNQVQFLILSNYDDFEYVRKGLIAGASDYLLKSQCDNDDIVEVLKKMNENIPVEENIQKQVTINNVAEMVMDYVQQNYESPIKLSNIANQLNYNVDYLSQAFKNYTGKNFNNYLTELRINKAKQYLSQGMKVKDVAVKVGYANEMYFSTVFKNETGCSPSFFSRNNIGKV